MSAPSFNHALMLARDHYGPESLSHVERVAQTAAELAERYGADTESARLAGLLHDWARELDAQTLIDTANRFGIPVTPLDRQVPYLLHARVGAALLRERFADLPQAIIDAVGAHTCGADEMSALEKIVYVADMIEPGRDFTAADDLRRAGEAASLDEFFRLAYTRSVEHLIETRRHIHPDTVAVWNAQVADGGLR